MAPEDRAIAERVHATVAATAPGLSPKTWYGMPAYVNADGKVVVSFKNSGNSTPGTRRWSSRMPRTSTTATCGLCRSRCSSGALR